MIKQHTRPSSTGFKETLAQAQSHMNKPTKLYSQFIHSRFIEILSDILSNTLFRPLPILCGGLFAILLPACLWIIAKYYGYGLSGSESVFSFVLGWVVGYIIDYVKLLVFGRTTRN